MITEKKRREEQSAMRQAIGGNWGTIGVSSFFGGRTG
jgi:hypothetical protein